MNDNDMNDPDWFEKQSKSMFRQVGIFGALAALASLGCLAAVIYFIFWCLKHFGVI